MKAGNSELVGLVEVARRLGLTREWVRRLTNEGRFPEPVGHLGGRKVWRWAHVRRWGVRYGYLDDEVPA